MLRSLYAGISGLRNFQTKMDIIGNNIANVNTVAFKGSRITFAESMAQELRGAMAPTETEGGINPLQVGLGMSTLAIDADFNQGSLESTGVFTDLAIQGNGFFIVTDGVNDYYTRAGTFNVDADGNMVMSGNGFRVKGNMAGSEGEIDLASAGGIQIPLGRRSQANATTDVTLYGNLDMNMSESRAELTDAGLTGISYVDGIASDGVGGRHTITISGENATRSSASSDQNGLELTDTLSDLGVSDVTGFSVTIDNGSAVELTGLDADSTIAALIRAINTQLSGVEAELSEDGAITLTRTYYGDGADYNIQLNDGDAGSDLVATLFGAPTFDVNNGQASTLVAVDVFNPNDSSGEIETVLELETIERTGLVTGLDGVGGSGVTIRAPEGLSAGTAVIDTGDTSHATSIFVYDSLGNTHNLTINFIRTADPGVWRWTADLPEPVSIINGASGEIHFSDDGSLESFTYDNEADRLTIDPGNGARIMEVTLNVGSFGEMDGMTQTASTTSAQAIGQNGYGMGELQNVNINDNGVIFGNYSNGVTETLAKVLLANFTNPNGLERMGDNLYGISLNSGEAKIIEAEQIGSKINSGYLEMSNVDLAREFTEMIQAQRAFQANARVITTSDMLLQEVTSLKR